MRKKRRQPKKRSRTREEFTVGPIRIPQAGSRIAIKNQATLEEFAAMRDRIARWRSQAPAGMRRASEATLTLISDLDPLVAVGFVFSHHHLAPQLSGKEMSQSYALVEHLALLLAKEPHGGTSIELEPELAQQLLDSLTAQLREAIQFTMTDLPADGSTSPDEPFREALATILSWELSVRGERYDRHQKELIGTLFTPFADQLRLALGFGCSRPPCWAIMGP